MAKYAVGFVVAFLLLGLFLLARLGFGGELVAVRGFGVVGMPAPPPVAFTDPGQPMAVRPPDLIVTDSNKPVPLQPLSFCWSEGNVSGCADGVGPDPGSEPLFMSTKETKLHLDFQVVWDVVIQVEPDGGDCPAYSMELGVVSEHFLETLGPPDDYLLTIIAAAEQGDASWVIRVDNQADLPLPAGISC